MAHDDVPSRRRFLELGGLSALGVALVACSSDKPKATGTTSTSSGAVPPVRGLQATTLTAADFADLGTCSLMAEKTAGPFPLDQQFMRRDVTEGSPGRPLRLGLRVVDSSCTAVPGAAVEIWHCDATGDYSAFADGGGGKDDAQGTTFLRGTQIANDDGIVEFATIYPGWYTGRAVHIHLRVHRRDAIVLTSQMFFDEDYTAKVYGSAPYQQFGLPDTSNTQDSIAGNPQTEGTLLRPRDAKTAKGAGTLALLNLGVRT
jgi:protocatechuate 3,4-dioxygenase beta subunit